MEVLLMGILLLGAVAAFVKTSGLRKVVLTFDHDNDEPPKRLYP
jgi:hypothetical protein